MRRFRLAVALLSLAYSESRFSECHAAPLRFATWQMQEGLPSNKVTSALQARDGYIWAATYEGLARFDGVSFTRFDAGRVPEMLDSSITAIFESRDGALWAGHGSGGISRYAGGKFTVYPPLDSREQTAIQNLAEDDAGDVWALDVEDNLIRVRDRTVLRPEQGIAKGVYMMAGTPDGDIWIVAGGKLSRLHHGTLEVVPLITSMGNYVHGVAAARDGGLWVVAVASLWKRTQGAWSVDLGGVATKFAPVVTLTELADGTVAGGTFNGGAFILSPGHPDRQVVLNRESGFPSDWISAIFQDHEGSVWMATGTAGLVRVTTAKVTMMLPEDRFQGRAVMSVAAAPSGEWWVGTEGAGVYRYRGDQWTVFRDDLVPNYYIWSIGLDNSGTVWAGAWGTGPARFDGTRFVDGRNGGDGADTGVAAMIPAQRGGMWVGSLQGIYHVGREPARWLEPRADKRRLVNVRALLEDSNGDLWAGMHGFGLGCAHPDGSIQVFTHVDGLASDYVDCLHRDATGTLWIGTHGGGLSRWKDGRFSTVNTAHGLGDNVIGDIEEDGRGYVWMSSKSGVLRVADDQLQACADGRLPRVDCVRFGSSDGLTTLNCTTSVQPAGGKLPDGRIVFATDRGLAVIDPATVHRNPVPPPVTIESVVVGDRHVAFAGTDPRRIEVAPGVNRIEIHYTALSFAGPEKVVFRRQLRPIEPSPTHVAGERTAVYSFLPPGEYVFHVTAANNDGVWNPRGADLVIILQPHFWQTAWFKVASVLTSLAATAGVAWSISRRRLARRLERLNRERAIERERMRIAHDMHDELGAQLTTITMLSESARRTSAPPVRTQQQLQQIYETARHVTKAMDEIVWAVNPKHDTFESLVAYFEKFTVDFLRAANVRCRLDLPLDAHAWTPSSEVRHQLFLCLKEALNNVVRHSAADTVTLSIRVSDTTCTMIIADNGAAGGSSTAGEPPDRFSTGNGLSSMQERMQRIQGTCTVESNGAGWVLTFTVPLAANAPAAADTE